MKKNPVSMIDIRPRLLILIGSTVLFFLPGSIFTGPVFFCLFFALSAGTEGLKVTVKTIGRILPVLILVSIVTPVFNRQGEAVISIGEVVLFTSSGFTEAVRMVCRFAGITLLFSIFYRGTREDELISGLRWYGLPFRGALVINLSLRFIPELFILYERVKDAHSLRESGESSGGVLKRTFRKFSNTLPHLTSVLILSIKKISPLSMSLHMRGGNISKGRSCFNPLPGGRKVAVQFIIFFLVYGAIISALVMSSGV